MSLHNTLSPSDSTDGQEGDGTEGDQNYYYDETGRMLSRIISLERAGYMA